MRKAKKPIASRILDANARCNQWLADGNAAEDAGNRARASRCFEKSQFWRDRYNLLTGRSDRPAPKE